MSIDNIKKYKLKIKVSEKILIPYSFISRNFYTNSLRFGFLMNKIENKYKVFLSSDLLRILLNLYNSPKLLKKLGILFDLHPKNIFQFQEIKQILFIDDFFEILAFLISKGLIIQTRDSKLNKILFYLMDDFKDLMESISEEILEPLLNERLELIQNLLDLWKPDKFLKFIHEEVRELI